MLCSESAVPVASRASRPSSPMSRCPAGLVTVHVRLDTPADFRGLPYDMHRPGEVEIVVFAASRVSYKLR